MSKGCHCPSIKFTFHFFANLCKCFERSRVVELVISKIELSLIFRLSGKFKTNTWKLLMQNKQGKWSVASVIGFRFSFFVFRFRFRWLVELLLKVLRNNFKGLWVGSYRYSIECKQMPEASTSTSTSYRWRVPLTPFHSSITSNFFSFPSNIPHLQTSLIFII